MATDGVSFSSSAILFAVANPVLSPASPQAAALSRLFVITLFICAVIFVIVSALVLLCIVRFRRKPDDAEPKQITGNSRLEVSWTVASILVLVLLFVLTVHAMDVADPVTDRKPDLTVIGHQWWWEVRYPNGAVAANEIHIPAGTDILMRVDSADVIHDFWTPELGRKIDMIPGHPNHVWIRADKPGEYLGACSEYCGAEHAWMRILVVAEDSDDYKKWESRQAQPAPTPDSDAAHRGLNLFRQMTCMNCHTIKGVNPDINVGPDLTHLAGRATIGSGVMKNTPANLRRWLENPQAIKPGCHMPNFHLSKDQVNDLAAYLETMK